MKVPEIRINFSRLLYQGASKNLKSANPNFHMPEVSECQQLASDYRDAWRRLDGATVVAMQEITGLEFYKDVIDVSLAPCFRPQSTPLLINFISNPDRFTDILTHELIHVLLTDNTTYSSLSSQQLSLTERWSSLFPANSMQATIHVPVHAIHKLIFDNYLDDGEKRYDREMKEIQNREAIAYLEAWKIVNERGADDIVKVIRLDYDEIKQELNV